VACGLYISGDIFKVTNPANPLFNSAKFQFSDYHTRDEMLDALEVICKAVTSLADLDKTLVSEGATKEKARSPRPAKGHIPAFPPEGYSQYRYKKLPLIYSELGTYTLYLDVAADSNAQVAGCLGRLSWTPKPAGPHDSVKANPIFMFNTGIYIESTSYGPGYRRVKGMNVLVPKPQGYHVK